MTATLPITRADRIALDYQAAALCWHRRQILRSLRWVLIALETRWGLRK